MVCARPCGKISLAAVLLAAFMTLGLARGAWALGFDFTPLDERTYNRLPEEAREAYDAFLEAADRINYPLAMEELNHAVKAAPESMELRFLAVRLAKYHGQMHTGVDAVKFLDMAIEHAKAILAIPNLPRRQIARAQYEVERLEKQRNTVGQRDEARRTYGLQIARQYAKEVYPSTDRSAEVKAFQDAVNQLTAGGKSPAALAAARALAGAGDAGSAAKPEGAEAAKPESGAGMANGASPSAETAPATEPAPVEDESAEAPGDTGNPFN